MDKARQSWQGAAHAAAPTGRRGPQSRLSDRQVQTYFQALAKRKLGQTAEAETALRGLVDAANRELERGTEGTDSTGAVGARQPQRDRTAFAHYVAGLGHLGLGEAVNAKTELTLALKVSPDCLGAKVELARLK